MKVGMPAAVLLYWLPLGAGGRVVRWNGRAFEALVAHHEHRRILDLYHSALQVIVDGERFVVEMTPAWGSGVLDRGVVRVGAVGLRGLGRFRIFRYEVRRWRGGAIPDVEAALDGPRLVSHDPDQARRLLELVPEVPALTWGRDERRTGEMWNSNSLIAWLLARAGVRMADCRPPRNGRAPGWRAGMTLAADRSPALLAQPPMEPNSGAPT